MNTNQSFDAVVIGGGPAGSAAAITLARAGRRVLLAEAVAQVPFKIGEALPPSVKPLLRDLGLEERVAAAGHLPCPGTVAAWGDERAEERDFIRELHGSGWHLDRSRFDADLRTAAAEAGAEVRTDCSFVRWRRLPPPEGWELRFDRRGATVRASATWVVDATGRRALFASHYGGAGRAEEGLVAFCVVASSAAGVTDARTFIESAADGWWYSALLPGGRRVVAFFTDDDLPAAREAAAPAGFVRRLGATFHVRHTVGELPPAAIDRVRRFPAGGVSRKLFAGAGWVAVGDATLAFDPLSSQGIFHALYTGLRGAQTAMDAMAGNLAALPVWHERLVAIHTAYREHLTQCYRAEPRWPDAPFWQRRHSPRTGADEGEQAASAPFERAPATAGVFQR